MRVYVSGPMSGMQAHNFPAFHDAAKKLTEAGYDVINPAENFGGRTDLSRPEYMRLDIEHVLQADGIALLPGWDKSAGAMLEVAIAQELDIPIGTVIEWQTDAVEDIKVGPGRILNAGGQKYPPREQQLAAEPESILQEAQRLVVGDRGHQYGRPIQDFSRTAKMWDALFSEKLKPGAQFGPQDVGLGMIAVKLSREVNKHKRDTVVDIAGYALTVQMVHEDLEQAAT